MIPLWLIKRVGEKWAPRIVGGLAIVILLGGVFLLGRCTGGKDTAQVEQNSKSAAAVGDAAQGAIKTLENRTVTDKEIDKAVADANAQIGNAQSAGEVRSAVLAAVCAKPQHRNDPACQTKGNGQ